MKTLRIIQDEEPSCPREDDNLGTMCCAHNRYTLGDKDPGYTIGDAGSWAAEEEAIRKQFDVVVILPIYMYDHSGQTVRTSPFECHWDSGQIGFIWVSKEKARKEYGWKMLTKARIAKLTEYLEAEVNTYDQWMRGDVYGFEVIDEEGELEDSCWGFYGSDPETNGMKDHLGGDLSQYKREAA